MSDHRKRGPYKTKPIKNRFWENVRKTESCWWWKGTKNKNGYGVLGINGKTKLAHRLSWAISVSEIPIGKHVLHTCDNPSCVRPSHLFIGTQADNNLDMHNKGRSSGGSLRGQRNPNAKLTESDVSQIRKLVKQGISQVDLARQHGVHKHTINNIIKGRNWA